MYKLLLKFTKNNDLKNYILSEIFSKLSPIINIFLFLNFLSVEQFGELANINVIFSFLALLIANGSYTYFTSQFFKKTAIENARVVSAGLIISFAITILLILIYLIFQNYFNSFLSINTIFLILLIVSSFFNSFSKTFFSFLRVNFKSKSYLYNSIIFNFSLLAGTYILLACLNLELETRVVILFSSNIIIFLIGFYELRDMIFTKFSVHDLAEIFSFGCGTIFHNLSFFLKDGAYKFLITIYIGLEFNAYFSLIFYHVFFLQSINIAYFNYFSPILINGISHNNYTKKSVKKMILNYSIVFLILSVCIGLVMYVLIYLYKPNYFLALPFVKYIIFYSFFYCINTFPSQFFFIKKKPNLLSKISFSSSFLVVFFSFFFFEYGFKQMDIFLFIITIGSAIQFYFTYSMGVKLIKE